jgi:hypothetical protein
MALFKKWARPGELVIFDWDHHYPLEVMVNQHSDILVLRPYYTVYRIRERIPCALGPPPDPASVPGPIAFADCPAPGIFC